MYNPIPQPESRPSREAGNPTWPGDGRRIITVGALKEQKNHALLLRAFAIVHRRKPASLLILGEGPLRPALESQLADLGLEGVVSMPGFKLEPAPYYSSADLFVLSSDYEGFGNVLVEAMGAGLQVLSTDCPSGPSEILEGGKYGRLVPVGDADALADAIEESLARPIGSPMLKERARQFRPEIAGEKYLEFLLGDSQD